jgi:uncharacterized protein (TIGR03083 family)
MGQGAIVDRDRLSAAALRVVERIAGMVRDLSHTDIPIPRSEWTVGETAAHLAFTNIGLAIMARGLFIPYADGTREGFAAANADSLEGYSDRDGAVLAGRIVDGMRAFVAEAAAQPPGELYQTPMGTMDMDTFASYALTHNLMHGCAIADGVGAPYPFEPDLVPMVWPFLGHAIPLMVDRGAAGGLDATIELRSNHRFSRTLVFGGGKVTVGGTAPGPVDCSITADPLTLFLVIVKLVSVADAIDRGSLTISGPRPELGPMLPSFYEMP